MLNLSTLFMIGLFFKVFPFRVKQEVAAAGAYVSHMITVSI